MAGLKQIPSTALTADDATPQEELGSLRYESNGKVYRYVAVRNLTANKGNALAFTTSNNYYTSVSHPRNRLQCPAGVAIGTITLSRYGWLQCGGFGTYLHTSNRGTSAFPLILMSGNNRLATAWDSTSRVLPFARTLKTDSGSILNAFFFYGIV